MTAKWIFVLIVNGVAQSWSDPMEANTCLRLLRATELPAVCEKLGPDRAVHGNAAYIAMTKKGAV